MRNIGLLAIILSVFALNAVSWASPWDPPETISPREADCAQLCSAQYESEWRTCQYLPGKENVYLACSQRVELKVDSCIRQCVLR